MRTIFQVMTKRTWSIFCFSLLLIGWSIGGNAQETDNTYRNSIKELIATNKHEGVSKNLLLIGGPREIERDVWPSFLVNMGVEQENMADIILHNLFKMWRNFLGEYKNSSQFLDNHVDIFDELCRADIDVDAIQTLNRQLPFLKKHLDGKVVAKICNDFWNKAKKHVMKGVPQEFEMLVCSDSCRAQLEQYYSLADVQQNFFKKDLELIKDSPQYASHFQEFKEFYTKNFKNYFLTQCFASYTESELDACIQFLSSRPTSLEKIESISKANEEYIVETNKIRFERWIKENKIEECTVMGYLYTEILENGGGKTKKLNKKHEKILKELFLQN